jgi:hypothetical protein
MKRKHRRELRRRLLKVDRLLCKVTPDIHPREPEWRPLMDALTTVWRAADALKEKRKSQSCELSSNGAGCRLILLNQIREIRRRGRLYITKRGGK